MKKFISALLTAGMLFSMSSAVMAEESQPVVYLNGEQMSFDVQPFIENDRTLVPMRAIFEAIGANVTWDGEKETVFGVKENAGDTLLVSLQIGSTAAFAGTEEITLDTPAQIKEDTTFVPLRFVSESLGATVTWDNENYAVNITVD